MLYSIFFSTLISVCALHINALKQSYLGAVQIQTNSGGPVRRMQNTSIAYRTLTQVPLLVSYGFFHTRVEWLPVKLYAKKPVG